MITDLPDLLNQMFHSRSLVADKDREKKREESDRREDRDKRDDGDKRDTGDKRVGGHKKEDGDGDKSTKVVLPFEKQSSLESTDLMIKRFFFKNNLDQVCADWDRAHLNYLGGDT